MEGGKWREVGRGWLTIVESNEGLILIIETLDGVRRSLGEVPDITLLERIDGVVSVLIDSGNQHAASIDVTPLSLQKLISTHNRDKHKQWEGDRENIQWCASEAREWRPS